MQKLGYQTQSPGVGDYCNQTSNSWRHMIEIKTLQKLEAGLGIILLIGFKTNYAAYGAAMLTLLFAVAITDSFGVKEPLDYSVFAFSAGAFLLATMPHYKWSIDQLIIK